MNDDSYNIIGGRTRKISENLSEAIAIVVQYTYMHIPHTVVVHSHMCVLYIVLITKTSCAALALLARMPSA